MKPFRFFRHVACESPGYIAHMLDRREMDLIRRAADRGMPVPGICPGAQLVARALGGEAQQGKTLEVGWHDVEWFEEEAAEVVFGNWIGRTG